MTSTINEFVQRHRLIPKFALGPGGLVQTQNYRLVHWAKSTIETGLFLFTFVDAHGLKCGITVQKDQCWFVDRHSLDHSPMYSNEHWMMCDLYEFEHRKELFENEV